jgi:heavy metal sensor kinase
VLKASGIDPSTIQRSKEGDLRDLGDRPLLVRDAAGYQLWRRGPAGSIIVVGRSIEPERRRLRWLTWQVTLSGAAVFAVGLLGGWWLSASAIRPIAAMSATAASISANNLAQRVDLAQFDAEFSDLARTMNEMLDRLELSFRQQAQFTSDASHELRTPLAVILSHIELSLSQARSGEEYRETLATCQLASQRMRVLVDNLLTLARADAGRLELQPRAVDLLQIACDTTELLAPLAAQHGIKLSVEGHASRSLADPLRLAQVVTNLVTNAILYNRRGGAVILHVAEESAASVLNVADTGIGIAEHDLPHLFDRFYRVDRARSRDSGGSGLGLAIARSIITALGGTLTVTSELGVGSTFTIRLPKA